MKEFKEFLKKKLASSKPMKDPSLMEARKSALGGLKEDMASRMGDKLGGLKKVTVAAPSEKGLKEGLDIASEIAEQEESEDGLMADALEGEDEGIESENALSDDAMEEDEQKDPQDMSPEELDAYIQELQQIKAQKAGE